MVKYTNWLGGSRRKYSYSDEAPRANYKSPCLVRLREIITKHFLSVSVEELTQEVKVETFSLPDLFTDKFSEFREALEGTFPVSSYPTLG